MTLDSKATIKDITKAVESLTAPTLIADAKKDILAEVIKFLEQNATGCSIGMISYFPTTTPSEGWLKCNGEAVSRTKYARLFNIIGTNYGVGDGSSTFNLPDLRGEFIRGFDDGKGVDSGRTLGSKQADELKNHSHTLQQGINSPSVSSGRHLRMTYFDSHELPLISENDKTISNTGGTETRPRNVALLACIYAGSDTSSNTKPITPPVTNTKIYGVRINKKDSNPNTAVEYINDAVGMTPSQGNNGSFIASSWDDKFPFNLITTETISGNIFSKFPKIYWSITSDDNYVYVRYSDTKVDSTYKALAHTKNGAEKSFIYIGQYLGIESSGKLISTNVGPTSSKYIKDCTGYSWGTSGSLYKPIPSSYDTYNYSDADGYKGTLQQSLYSMFGDNSISKIYYSGYVSKTESTIPTTNKILSQFRTLAQANGTGYGLMNYYMVLMLQVLFVVRFKSLDSQTALGKGIVNGSLTNTGSTATLGMNWGETSGALPMKFCGIENLWGNCLQFIDGLVTDSNKNILINDSNINFNDIGTGYINYGKGDGFGFISDIQGTTEKGFIPKVTNGGETTYYCDLGSINASSLLCYGGNVLSKNGAGVFYFGCLYNSTSTDTNLSTRLAYMPD